MELKKKVDEIRSLITSSGLEAAEPHQYNGEFRFTVFHNGIYSRLLAIGPNDAPGCARLLPSIAYVGSSACFNGLPAEQEKVIAILWPEKWVRTPTPAEQSVEEPWVIPAASNEPRSEGQQNPEQVSFAD